MAPEDDVGSVRGSGIQGYSGVLPWRVRHLDRRGQVEFAHPRFPSPGHQLRASAFKRIGREYQALLALYCLYGDQVSTMKAPGGQPVTSRIFCAGGCCHPVDVA